MSVSSETATSNAKMKRVLRAGAIGNFIEFFDFTIYGFFAVTIAALFFPKGDSVAALLATFALFGVAFFIRPIGAMVFGHIGDRFGRKRALIFAIVLMSSATACIGLLPTFSAVGVVAPLLLLLCRLAQGFSTGGEQSGAYVLVVEHSPIKKRGRNGSLVVTGSITGVGCAALLGLAVALLCTPEQLLEWGWRIPFLIAAPLGLLGLYLRMNIDESEVYKTASDVVKKATRKHVPLAQAFRQSRKEMTVLLGWTALVALSGYMLVGYYTTHLVTAEGYAMPAALAVLIVGHAVAALGVPMMGRLADRCPRKKFALGVSIALAVWTFPTFLLMSMGPVFAAIGIAVFAIISYSAMVVSSMAVVELFPVDVRYSASALPFQLGFAVFGGTAPFIATWLVANFDHLAPAYYITAMACFGALLAVFGLPNAREMAVTTVELEDQDPERNVSTVH
ncbi:MFS transporter [Pseudarthrobacter sulfonivorans]|uniref:MFS transporter n=1 Tax=Pseudarthrobacter sulfonivorans TaxID=121292 RepID=UPI00168AC2A2|nr:MFS transporter [Pseudarthrobacter sulfonivorans]